MNHHRETTGGLPMKVARISICTLMTVGIAFGATGCGVFDEMLTLASGATKLASGQTGDLTANEWEVMSGMAASLGGDSALALSTTEAQALVDFFAVNDVDDFSDFDNASEDLQGLNDLATAFASRADGQDVDFEDPEAVQEFFQSYLRDIGESLQSALSDLGIGAGAFGGSGGEPDGGGDEPGGGGGSGEPGQV